MTLHSRKNSVHSDRINVLEIFSKNILKNISLLQSLHPKSDILPVLKANAYGHGIKEICKILKNSDIPMVAVYSFPEAELVYKYSEKRVLIMGEIPLKAYEYCNFSRTDFCIYNDDTFIFIAKKYPKSRVHLFINTGMNREGIKDLSIFLERTKKYLNMVNIVGFCSHLVSADVISDLNSVQEKLFFDNLKLLRSKNINPYYIHLGNSVGTFTLKNSLYTAFRPGIAMYGYNIFAPSHPMYIKANNLKPSLRLTSKIIAIQSVKKGEVVSYNERFIVPKDGTIGIIPFGYHEGLDRRLANNAVFMLCKNGKRFPLSLVGSVCMNLSCIYSDNLKIELHDTIELISPNIDDINSFQSLANRQGTLVCEILAKLQPQIHKIIR